MRELVQVKFARTKYVERGGEKKLNGRETFQVEKGTLFWLRQRQGGPVQLCAQLQRPDFLLNIKVVGEVSPWVYACLGE
jgi:hypothetical protein